MSSELQRELERQAETHAYRIGAPSGAVFVDDGEKLLFLRAKGESNPTQGLYQLTVATGAEIELVRPEELTEEKELSAEEKARRERQRIAARGFVQFEASRDGKRVLLPYAGKLYVFERDSRRVVALPGSEGALDARFSPDGNAVAFVAHYDMHVLDLRTHALTRLTKGGSEARSYGLAEFIAQEELARSRGYFFSPDGATLAVQITDQSKVEQLAFADPARPERMPERPYYPRAGTANAEVGFLLIPRNGGKARPVKWDTARFPYVAQARWEPHAPLVLYVMSRDQRDGSLLAVNADGSTRELLREHDDAWLNIDASVPRFLDDGRFVWSTEQSGHYELGLHAKDGTRQRVLLGAEHGYRNVVGVDENHVFCNAGSEPTDGMVLQIPVSGGAPVSLGGASQEHEQVEARTVSSKGLLLHRSSLQEWPRLELWHRASAQAGFTHAGVVKSTQGTPAALPRAERLELGKDRVRALLVRPRAAKPGEKRPILDAAYGGPHVTLAVVNALALARAQWMADATGALVVILDARGTPRRGREWERPLYGKLGELPLQGHVDAIRDLAKQVPEADIERVGIYGWSFGGYLAALAALAEPGFFKAAMAGAPPADWRDYDTAYTERYLGMPDADAAAYDHASLLTWAGKPGASAPLLLVHGTADDNVYFLHSLKLADAMTRAHKTYEFLPLANVTHMLWEKERYVGVWGRTAQFFVERLR